MNCQVVTEAVSARPGSPVKVILAISMLIVFADFGDQFSSGATQSVVCVEAPAPPELKRYVALTNHEAASHHGTFMVQSFFCSVQQKH